MKFCEYQPGRFVNPQFIVRVSIEYDAQARIGNYFSAEELRRRMAVVLEIEGDVAPVRVAEACLDRVAEMIPMVERRMRELELAMIKAQVISTLCRFPLAA